MTASSQQAPLLSLGNNHGSQIEVNKEEQFVVSRDEEMSETDFGIELEQFSVAKMCWFKLN